MDNQWKTNKQTIDWLKSTEAQGDRVRLLEAQIFFGNFPGDHSTFKRWKLLFDKDHYNRRKNAQRSLMKECGGTGKHNEIPPDNYFPDNLKLIQNENHCTKCDKTFESKEDLKEHIK